MTEELAGMVDILAAYECWELLRGAEVGRLAIVASGRPEIFPLNFAVDHGTVVFRTAAGVKMSARPGAAVAFEADGYDRAQGMAWSVVLHGELEPLISFEPLDTEDLPLYPLQSGPKPLFVRIIADSISGRRFHAVDKSEWQLQS